MPLHSIFAALFTLLVTISTSFAIALEPGWRDDQAIDVGGETRYYRVFVPESLPSTAPATVFVLHGGTGSMRSIMPPADVASAEWPALADRHRFILIVPNGINRNTGDAFGDDQNWNDCRDNVPGDIRGDDVAFLDALIDWSLDALGTDPTRVYFTGASNGGMMSLRMASERPEQVAAVAAFIANQPDGTECAEPTRGVPMLLAHGTEDPLVPYAGGPVVG
ncbi:MAG: alpha/beta hydrolase family esterase, partial [Wenzhouxiangellaceae bacterium]